MRSRATSADKRPAKKAAGGKTSVKKRGVAKKTARSKATTLTPIEHLRGDEAKLVLQSIVDRHPKLRSEALELATATIEAIDARRLGAELSKLLLDLDIFDLADSSRDGSYSPMWEAAPETLDTLLEPYLLDLQRRIELGLEEAARATCLGIILGLYGAREDASGDSLLAYAPDFCENEAHYVVGLLAKQSGRLHRRRWPLPEGSEALLPDWSWLFGQGAKRRKRRR